MTRINQRIKDTVRARQRYRCALCDIMLPAAHDIDHKIPRYRGGTDELSNLQALCKNCHGEKSADEAYHRYFIYT